MLLDLTETETQQIGFPQIILIWNMQVCFVVLVCRENQELATGHQLFPLILSSEKQLENREKSSRLQVAYMCSYPCVTLSNSQTLNCRFLIYKRRIIVTSRCFCSALQQKHPVHIILGTQQWLDKYLFKRKGGKKEGRWVDFFQAYMKQCFENSWHNDQYKIPCKQYLMMRRRRRGR